MAQVLTQMGAGGLESEWSPSTSGALASSCELGCRMSSVPQFPPLSVGAAILSTVSQGSRVFWVPCVDCVWQVFPDLSASWNQ